MNRKHLPKLTNNQIGIDGIAGWYFEPSTRDEGKEWVIFQCPNNHRASVKNHSIEPNGEINASILCYKNDYHEFCILDDWNDKYKKVAGSLYPVPVS